MGAKVEPSKLRAIPAVERILQALGTVDTPRPVTVALVRRELNALRKAGSIPSFDAVLTKIRLSLADLRRTRIQPVINGTGIVIHTNLGRSPLGAAVANALQCIAVNYSNLELDLRTGQRGGRGAYLENALALLCGSESATATNNCAAALVLILRYFTSGDRKEVVISRGELVQIGGGFRIPEILEASGAVLREVGATNKTSLVDYRKAVGGKTALILKVHRSNFFMSGFVESPSTEEIAQLAKTKRIPFVEDLGSGAVIATETLGGLDHEPTPREVLKRGVDLVCFSGDKLLGGPQAGLIAGKNKFISALKKEPLFRALRCDKLILSALEATVDIYLRGEACEEMPALAMLRCSREELELRGNKLAAALEQLPVRARIVQVKAQVGGGTLPQAVLPSTVLALQARTISLKELASRLRSDTPPVIGYIAGGSYNLDLRTIFPRQDAQLILAVRKALSRD